MKNHILVVFVFLAGKFFAADMKESLSFVHVVSDQPDASVPKGKCLITGIVYYEEQSGQYNFLNKACDSLVSAFYSAGKGKQEKVDGKGAFRILVDTSERYLTFEASMPGQVASEIFETIYLEHYPFGSGHRIELAVYLPLKSRHMMIEVDKPVIYAYADRELDFSLALKAKGDLHFSYPPLPENKTWNMHLEPSGRMSDPSGKSYPYLFWEAEQQAQSFSAADLSSDEILAQSELLPYLETSLTALGLNQQEKTDFITYWCPKMLSHPFVRVQFYVDEQCAVIGDLEIHPQPDAVRRVYAVFRGTDKISDDFEPRRMLSKPFKREGFVVLEWGGSEWKPQNN